MADGSLTKGAAHLELILAITEALRDIPKKLRPTYKAQFLVFSEFLLQPYQYPPLSMYMYRLWERFLSSHNSSQRPCLRVKRLHYNRIIWQLLAPGYVKHSAGHGLRQHRWDILLLKHKDLLA